MADIEIRQESPTAFYIKVHETDNVAIIVNDNGLKAGTRFPDGLELIEHIPQGHKVALLDIPVHGEIVRYGEVIGYAVRDIPRGSWIDESMVELPKAPPLETLPLATKVPEPLPPLEGYTFEGYRNADGSVGTKNLLGISTSVHCVAGVVDYVVKSLSAICCLNTRTLTVWWGSIICTAAAWRSMLQPPLCRFVPFTILRLTRILAVK